MSDCICCSAGHPQGERPLPGTAAAAVFELATHSSEDLVPSFCWQVTPKENARFLALLKAMKREEPPEFPLVSSQLAQLIGLSFGTGHSIRLGSIELGCHLAEACRATRVQTGEQLKCPCRACKLCSPPLHLPGRFCCFLVALLQMSQSSCATPERSLAGLPCLPLCCRMPHCCPRCTPACAWRCGWMSWSASRARWAARFSNVARRPIHSGMLHATAAACIAVGVSSHASHSDFLPLWAKPRCHSVLPPCAELIAHPVH